MSTSQTEELPQIVAAVTVESMVDISHQISSAARRAFDAKFHIGDTGDGPFAYIPPRVLRITDPEATDTSASVLIGEFLDDERHRVLLLLGDYGSGKSALTDLLLSGGTDIVEGRTVVKITCRADPNCDPNEIRMWLDSALRAQHHLIDGSSYEWNLSVDDLIEISRSVDIVLIIDGVDELSLSPSWSPERTLVKIVEAGAKFPFKTIITGRDIYRGSLDKRAMPLSLPIHANGGQQIWRLSDLLVARLVPFSESEVEAYFLEYRLAEVASHVSMGKTATLLRPLGRTTGVKRTLSATLGPRPSACAREHRTVRRGGRLAHG